MIIQKLNLKYDFKDYSGIQENVFLFFFFFVENFVRNRKHCIAIRKKHLSKNYFTILLIKRFLAKMTDRLDFIFD